MNLLKYFLSLTLILGPYAQAWDQATSKVVQVDQASGVSSTPNYWKTGDAEVLLTGVAAYNDGASAKPVDCTGGSSTMTGVRSTTNPMYDKFSWLISKPAGNMQGQGVAFEFDVDNGVAAVEMMDVLFDYLVGSGTFVAGSDTTNSDIMVYLYDVTAGTLIEPKGGSKLYTSSTNVKGDYRGWFQSTLGSKKYRVCLHQATTSASAYTLKVDAGKVQKSRQVVGTIITDWQSYTPNITAASGTLTNYTLSQTQWMQVGQNIYIKGSLAFNGAAGTWTFPRVSLPSGVTLADNIPLPESVVRFVGPGLAYDGAVYLHSSTGFQITSLNGTNGSEISVSNTSPISFASGYSISWQVGPLKVAGWSAGARMSDGYDGRVVAASIRLAGSNQAVTSTADTQILYNQIGADPAGMVDLANNGIRVKSSDWYVVTTKVVGGNDLTAELFSVRSKVDGVILGGSDARSVSSGTNSTFTAVSPPTYITSGSLVTSSIQSTSDTSYSVVASAGTFLSVVKISGTPFMSPTALWETHYAGTAGDTIGTTDSLIKFTTKVEDTFGSYNPATGLWTAKGPAYCTVSSRVGAAINLSTSQNMSSFLYKNSSRLTNCSNSLGTGSLVPHSSVCSNSSVKLNTGDTLSIYAASSVAATSTTGQDSTFFTVSCRQSGN